MFLTSAGFQLVLANMTPEEQVRFCGEVLFATVPLLPDDERETLRRDLDNILAQPWVGAEKLTARDVATLAVRMEPLCDIFALPDDVLRAIIKSAENAAEHQKRGLRQATAPYREDEH